jgi:hypothetical protein
MLREDSARFTDIYRLLLRAARAEGIDRDRLPDFLDLEDGGEFALLGQDKLGTARRTSSIGTLAVGVLQTSRFRCVLSGSRGGRRCGGSGGRG